ncbi:MAG: terminase family protein [Planctomycetes bacterium]|nr:terminase family protein [Planctomycetota bacterium]
MAAHLAEIDRAIMDTILGRTAPLLIIEAPPRHGKSELISRYLPAWYLGMFPDRRVMLTGYSAAFARGWGRKARALMQEYGPAWFGHEVDPGVRAAEDWGLRGTPGGMVTAGIGGPLTGRGAHLLIIDDPLKNVEEAVSETICENHWDWWQTTASTRVEPGGCTIIIATRWARNDLSGRLLRAASQADCPAVRRLHLPALAEDHDPLGRSPGEALWPERWPREKLEQMRAERELRWWQALYQQDPLENPDAIWPDSYFGEHLWTENWPSEFEFSALAYDPALGKQHGDAAAIVFVGLSGGLYWVDAVVERLSPEAAVGVAIDLAQRYLPHCVVLEANLFQSLLAPEFDRQCRERRAPPLPMVLVSQSVPKTSRISRLGPLFMQGLVRLVRSPGCAELVRQLRRFPARGWDDGPDALELAIRMISQSSEVALGNSQVPYSRACS